MEMSPADQSRTSVRAELRGLSSIDLPDGKSLPSDPRDCRILLHAEIGTVGEVTGTDLFAFDFCTTDYLRRLVVTEDGFYPLQRTIVVEEFSWELAEQAIEAIIDQAGEAQSWSAIANEIGKYAEWEFA